MKRMITLSALLLAAGLAPAQYSVKEIDINKTGPLAGSEPRNFVEYQGRAYFTANDGIHGRELWWSDGDDAGMVADIYAGGNEGLSYFSDLCVVKGVLYFSANDGQYGNGLWRFDGKNPVQRAASSASSEFGSLQGLTELNDKLYFLGSAGNARRLYEFDPDSAWSFKADSIPGTRGWYEFSQNPVAFKGRIVFNAELDPAVGAELYQFIPGQGMSLVADIFPGTDWSKPKSMYVLGDKLFFLARDPQHGYELYMWDGVNPVKRLTDIVQGPGDSFYTLSGTVSEGTYLYGYNNKLYFGVSDGAISYPKFDVYTYDPASGVVKKQIPMKGNSPAQNYAVFDGKLYFTSHTNLYPNTFGPFVYDDVIGLADFNTSFPGLYLAHPAAVINRLFFSSADSGGSYELHVLSDPRALNVAEAASDNEAKVYPNPTTSDATISFTLKQSAKLNAQLTDIQGRVVYTTEAQRYSAGSHQIKMPVQQLAAGNYIYAIMNETGEVMAKGQLVKE